MIEGVANISESFCKIAAHHDFWKGNVFIYKSTVILEDLVDGYLCDGTKGLWVCKRDQIMRLPGDVFAGLARKCPKLRQLSMDASVKIWLDQPWKSMEEMYNIHWRAWPMDVELHRSLPNLKSLCLTGGSDSAPIVLPDMAGCDKLQRLHLSDGFFCTRVVSVFPAGLKSLVLANANFTPHSTLYKLTHEEVLDWIKKHLSDCKVEVFTKFDLLFTEMH